MWKERREKRVGSIGVGETGKLNLGMDLGWNPASNSEGGKGFLSGRFRRGEGL